LSARANDFATWNNAQGNDHSTLLSARANDLSTWNSAQGNDHSTLISAYANDYNTLSAAIINDFLAYLNTLANDGVTLAEARANDYNSLTYVLANSVARFTADKYFDSTVYSRDIIPQANTTYSLGSESARWANIWVKGATIFLGDAALSSAGASLSFPEGSTLNGVDILANDGVTLLSARANDLSTWNSAQGNDHSTLLSARANDLLTWNSAQGNDHSTLLSARANDFSTYLTLTANIYNTYNLLSSNISGGSGNTSTVSTLAEKMYNFVGPVTTGSGVSRWYPSANITVTGAYLVAASPPSTGDLSVSVKVSGSSIGTVTLTSGLYKSTITTLNNIITTSDYVTIDVNYSNNASDASLTLVYSI
jgi:hypothetical protein